MTETMERLIFVDLGANNCKFWHGWVEGTTCKTNWGRVVEGADSGATGQSKDYTFGSVHEAQAKLESQVKSKLKKGYTRQHTIVNGQSAQRAVVPPTNIKAIATSQIQHGGNPQTIELIEFLVARNIHHIEGATTIQYVDGGLRTPLGPVTPEGLDEAERLLGLMALQGPDFAQQVNQYLRIVPRVIHRRGADPMELFGTPAQIQAEMQLIDAMRVVVTPNAPATQPNTPVVFQTKLELVEAGSYDFKRINEAFTSSINRNHASAGLRLQRVWAMEIAAMKTAFRKELKPVQKLWHGTKDANLLSILKGGYVIPKQGGSIAVTGRMYGDGVYFSNQSTKSLNYATGTAPGQYGRQGSQRKFMIWNDVAMGKMFMARHSFRGGCPVGYDSCFAKAGQSGVLNNEMIVYDTRQINPRFLCEFA